MGDFEDLLWSREEDVFVIMMRVRKVGFTYSHAATIKKTTLGLALFDSANSSIKYSKVQSNYTGWNVANWLTDIYALEIYVFQSKWLTDKLKAEHKEIMQEKSKSARDTSVTHPREDTSPGEKDGAKRESRRKMASTRNEMGLGIIGKIFHLIIKNLNRLYLHVGSIKKLGRFTKHRIRGRSTTLPQALSFESLLGPR